MERRFAIKQILILAGGLALLPSCLREAGKASIVLKNLDVDLDDEKLLGEIAETLIPKTNTPGAKELNLHLFVLKMVDDCEEEKDQQLFLKGLTAFKDFSKDKFSKPFADLQAAQRKKLLLAIEKDEQQSEELKGFYKIMKNRTVQGYLNSKYVMTNLNIYELVPGRYNGYFPVKSA